MLTIKRVELNIASLAKSNTKRSALVHETLVSITGHIFEHGDTRLADRILACFLKGTDKKAIRSWLTTYAPVNFNAVQKTFKLNTEKKALSEFDESYLMSEDCIRWDADTDEGDGALNPLDVYASLTRLLKNAEKAAKSGKREVQHADLVSELAALAIKYKLEMVASEVAEVEAVEVLTAH